MSVSTEYLAAYGLQLRTDVETPSAIAVALELTDFAPPAEPASICSGGGSCDA